MNPRILTACLVLGVSAVAAAWLAPVGHRPKHDKTKKG